MAAEGQRLAEGQPALHRKAVLDDRAPEDQHVDPGVGAAGGGICRHGERRLRRRRPPGLDPGHVAGLQLGDDLVGDVVVEARPVCAGASVAFVSGHRGSPRRAPEASPPALNPSRQTRSALSLSGRFGASPQKGPAETLAWPQGKAFPFIWIDTEYRSLATIQSLKSSLPIFGFVHMVVAWLRLKETS